MKFFEEPKVEINYISDVVTLDIVDGSDVGEEF